MRAGRYSTFEKHYQPLTRDDGSILFETYGDDLNKIIETKHNHIWTLLDCDGKLRIGAGYHIVNRMNYIITKYPWISNELCFSY